MKRKTLLNTFEYKAMVYREFLAFHSNLPVPKIGPQEIHSYLSSRPMKIKFWFESLVSPLPPVYPPGEGGSQSAAAVTVPATWAPISPEIRSTAWTILLTLYVMLIESNPPFLLASALAIVTLPFLDEA
jgi:hypothetical protein